MNPFDWQKNTTPTIFATDPAFKSKDNTGYTSSQLMSQVVKRKRAEAEEAISIYGSAKDREAAILHTRVYRQKIKDRNDIHKDTRRM